MKNRFLSTSIILVFLFNCFGKGLDAASFASISAGVLENQPVGQYSSLLCMVPIKIMNSLIGSKAARSVAPARASSKEQKAPDKNASSNYSILAPNNEMVKSGIKLLCLAAPEYALRSFECIKMDIVATHHPPGEPVALILFLILLFVVLPRNGVSESAVFFCLKT